MDPEYDDYFNRRLSGRLGRPFSREAVYPSGDPVLRVTARALDAAEAAVPSRLTLRSDARWLLYLLASELVSGPVLSVQSSEPFGAAEELANDLREDAARLVVSASTGMVRGGEITAHGIIDALSANWSNLRVAEWRVWDRAR